MTKELIIAIALITLGVIIIAYFVMRRCGMFKRAAGIDTIVGEKCVVTETIDNFAGCGQIKVKGQFWSARGFFDDDIFESGETLRIVAIEGVKAVCKKD